MSRHNKRRAEARAVGTLKAYHDGAHARCSDRSPKIVTPENLALYISSHMTG
jgi:hypothetical protein